MAKKLLLTIIAGQNVGKIYEVPKDGLRLGRSSSNDIHIPDEELSRNHCLFETTEEGELRITDLASANGTLLNGKPIGSEPVVLHESDVIEVGKTALRFGAPPKKVEPLKPSVDLGLNPEKKLESKKGNPLVRVVLWLLVLVVGGAAVYFYLNQPQTVAEAPTQVADREPQVKEVFYERVMADSKHIFRYELSVTPDDVLTVKIDDVPDEDRHLTKSIQLTAKAKDDLNSILAFSAIREISREYSGQESEPPVLDSWTLKVVYDVRSRTIHVTNTQEPEAFRTIREKLEAFSKSELGIWAIQYPREKLIELAAQSVETGNAKWEDRDVKYGNLAASIAAYNEAIFYLETVNPKPETFNVAKAGAKRSTEELELRYTDQRFLADRALNMAQWEAAKRELQVLLEMVPDRRDDRNRDAAEKLLSVERQLQKGVK